MFSTNALKIVVKEKNNKKEGQPCKKEGCQAKAQLIATLVLREMLMKALAK